MINCRQVAPIVDAIFRPALSTADPSGVFKRLIDGQTSTVAGEPAGSGVTTTATSTSPSITIKLDAVYEDIGAVGVWPYSNLMAQTALGQNLTITVHQTPNFATDAEATVCVRRLKTTTHYQTYTQCPATAAVQYVTIQRFSTSATALALMEVRVYRSGARLSRPPACVCTAPCCFLITLSPMYIARLGMR